MKKILICLLFSFSLYAEVSPYVAVRPVLGFATMRNYYTDVKADMKTNFGFGLAAGAMISVNETFGFKVEIEPTYRASMKYKLSLPDYKFNLMTLMANGNIVFNVGPISPYVGLGVGFTNFSGNDGDDDNYFSWQLGTGIGYKVVENFEVALGYRYVKLFRDDEIEHLELYAHDIVATASYYF